jgi:hypothetical protein
VPNANECGVVFFKVQHAIKYIMMKSVLLILYIVPVVALSQPLKQFNDEKSRIDQGLMLGLGSWAVSNFVASGIGWATVPEGEAHYFHQMNVLWNTVNLGLAIPGYLKAKNTAQPSTLTETMQLQRKTENIFLMNTGLDVVYMGSGLLLRTMAAKNVDKQAQFNGYGNSLLMQGGFLFLFDLTAYAIHKHHAKHAMPRASMSIRISSSGFGITWNVGTHKYSRLSVLI